MKKKVAGLRNIQPEHGKEVVKSTRSSRGLLDPRRPVAGAANRSPKVGSQVHIQPRNIKGQPGDGLPKFPVRAVSLRK
jgi:hypothetical protein